MIINPTDPNIREVYGILIGTVLPRPIAWVSSMDAEGRLNLAPYSFFTAVCVKPMTLIFCPGVSVRKGLEKDTLANVRQVGEFVVNITDEATAEAMNLTATELPPEASEFEWAGVTPTESDLIRVPRVAAAPVAYECKLQQIVTVSDQPGGGHVVFGEVQRIHIRDDILDADGKIDLDKLKPIGRLSGPRYTRVDDIFEMWRVPPPDGA